MSIVRNKEQAKKNLKINLERMLHARGWNGRDLVEACGEPQNTVYRILRGENVPDAVTLANIADALDTTQEKLIEAPPKENFQEVA